MGKILNILVAACVCAPLWSCNTSSCTENQSSLPLAAMYDAATRSKVSVSGVDVGGVGAPGDSLLHDASSALSSVYLPFRSSTSETSFYFRYTHDNAPEPDTITFVYTSEPYFVSAECGAMFNYRITEFKYTTHIIDSVAVTDSLINNIDIERIRIYVHTTAGGGSAGDDEEEEAV
ncbi:MAG: DUF6452 family protein [Muribaculaceae bacterium]|nr:DUF6452 family protein [Muribaculaceae bacterium]